MIKICLLMYSVSTYLMYVILQIDYFNSFFSINYFIGSDHLSVNYNTHVLMLLSTDTPTFI